MTADFANTDRATNRASLAEAERIAGAVKPSPILVADHVQRRFGGLIAVEVHHLEIQRGAITALIGPNGAGKTTLFNVLTGFDRPQSGRWYLDGRELTGMSPARIARQGMVRTFQLTKSLARLSVLDNLKLAAPHQRGERFLPSVIRPLWRPQEREIEERADELLRRFRLDHMRWELAGTLSGGQRKLLEMARALMVDPSILMLDEPMAGVNPALRQSLLSHVTALRDEGTTIVYIEHDMDVVMEISDWVVCLALGSIIAEGPPDHIAAHPDVISAYLGTAG